MNTSRPMTQSRADRRAGPDLRPVPDGGPGSDADVVLEIRGRMDARGGVDHGTVGSYQRDRVVRTNGRARGAGRWSSIAERRRGPAAARLAMAVVGPISGAGIATRRRPRAAPKATAPRQSSSTRTSPSTRRARSRRTPVVRSNRTLFGDDGPDDRLFDAARRGRAPSRRRPASRGPRRRAPHRSPPSRPTRDRPRAKPIPPCETAMSTAWARPMPPRLTSTFVALTSWRPGLADRDRIKPREPVVAGGCRMDHGHRSGRLRGCGSLLAGLCLGPDDLRPAGRARGETGGRATPRGHASTWASRAAASSAPARASFRGARHRRASPLRRIRRLRRRAALAGPSVPSIRARRCCSEAAYREWSRRVPGPFVHVETRKSTARSILRVGTTTGERHRRRIRRRHTPVAPRHRTEGPCTPRKRRRPMKRLIVPILAVAAVVTGLAVGMLAASGRAAGLPEPRLRPGRRGDRVSAIAPTPTPIAHPVPDTDARAHADPVADSGPDPRSRPGAADRRPRSARRSRPAIRSP